MTVTDQGGTGLAGTATVTVNLTDVNEAPAVTGFTTSIAENSALGTVVGSVCVSDPDAGDTFSYALTNGNTGGAFAIDASGQITVADPAALDFETVPGQAFTLEVDGHGPGRHRTRGHGDGDREPDRRERSAGGHAASRRPIAENSALGTVVGSVSVSDPDAGDTFSYALTNGNTAGAFAIDATGQITVANPAALDFETVPGQAFTLEVTVTDQGGTGLASTATVTVNLTDVNEAPAVTRLHDVDRGEQRAGHRGRLGGRERPRRRRHVQLRAHEREHSRCLRDRRVRPDHRREPRRAGFRDGALGRPSRSRLRSPTRAAPGSRARRR